MAIDTEAKRWSMLAAASGISGNIVFKPDTSGLVSIEKITTLRYYGGIAWDNPSAPSSTEAKRWSMLSAASGVGRNIVFRPDTSGLVSIEKITTLKYYGGIAWDNPSAPTFKAVWAKNRTGHIGLR